MKRKLLILIGLAITTGARDSQREQADPAAAAGRDARVDDWLAKLYALAQCASYVGCGDGANALLLFADIRRAVGNLQPDREFRHPVADHHVGGRHGAAHRLEGYGKVRGSSNRDDRKLAFDTFWGKWLEYRNSVGMVMNSHLQTQVALSKARDYDGVLHRELHQDKLPPAIYHTLVEEVNKALPTLHRYFRLRARMLGVEQLHYYDVYPPIVSLDKEFDLDTSKKITLEAMAVLGEDWVSMQKAAMDDRWMHVYPQRGKRSGAYMSGFAYDVHPYLLLNHNDDYASLSTFAHEWGHAMHTFMDDMERLLDDLG